MQMKKNLLFAATLFASMLHGVNAYAEGGNPPEAGPYYIENVGAGRFMEGGNSWGTQASISERGIELTLISNDDQTYSIHSNMGKGYLGANGFIDSDNANWTLTPAEDGAFIFSTPVTPEGSETPETKYLVWSGEGTALTIADEMPTTANGYFKFVTKDERVAALAQATADAPLSATFLIGDANFSRLESTAPWTITADNKNMSGGNNTNNCAESFHSTFTLTQSISIPAGVYSLTAQGFYRQDGTDNDNLPYFFIGEGKSTFQLKTGSENSMNDASNSFSQGLYTIDPIFIEVAEDGTVEVGAKNDVNASLWCIWDNFQLTYYGKDADLASLKLGAYVEQLKDARTAAEGYQTAELNETVRDLINQALTDTENVEETVEAYKTAIQTLTDANKAAKTCVENKAAIDARYALLASTNVYTEEAYNTFKATADAYLEQWNDGTLSETVVNPNSVQGWHATNDYDDFLLSAWGTNDFDSNLYINTWSVEGETDGSEFKVPFFEYWTNDANSLTATTKTATVAGLEAGKTYDVSAWVRVRIKNDASDPTGITLNLGSDGTPVDVTKGTQVGESQMYLAEFTATGNADAEGNLTINFNVAEDNNISWLSFKNVNYKAASAEPDEIIGTALKLGSGQNSSVEVNEGEVQILTFTSKWASCAINKTPIDNTEIKSVTFEFAEPTTCHFNVNVDVLAEGAEKPETQYRGFDAGITTYTLDLTEFQGKIENVSIQNTQDEGTHSLTINSAYLTGTDDSKQLVMFKGDWGSSVSYPNLTSTKATFNGQWASIPLRGAENIDGSIKLRFYANAPIPESVQYCVKYADNDEDGWPQIGRVTDTYAEAIIERPLSSLILQWTSEEAGTIDIKAVTWEKIVSEPTTYAITVAEGIENGAITTDVAEAKEGATVTITATPAEGYKLESISVKNGEEDVEVSAENTFEMPAAPVTISATFVEDAVEPDPNLIEIAQSQGKELDNFARTEFIEGEEYNTYTANADLQIGMKMMNIDVADCDYIVIKFAEEVEAGWKLGVYNSNDLLDIPAGTKEFKYVFADDPKCDVANGVLPQICMMTFFGGYTAPLVAKVEGVYKHKVASEPELATVENMTLTVAEDAVIEDEDKTFPVVFGYKAIVDESISPMASMSVTYKVTTNGEEILSETYEGIDIAKETQNIWIKNMEYGKTYTVTITSVSVSYFDLETETPGNNVAYTKTFAEDELTATFTTNAIPVSIDGINAAAKSNRKVVENGRVVIYKNGVKTMSSGVSIR